MYLETIKTGKNCPPRPRRSPILCLLAVVGYWASNSVCPASAAEPAASPDSSAPATKTATLKANSPPHFNVQAYLIEGNLPLSRDITAPLFSKYTGTNVSLDEIARAAADLQAAYRQQGYPTVSIVISPQRITNSTVTLNVFQGAFSQIVISGKRYSGSPGANPIAARPAPPKAAIAPAPAAAAVASVASHPVPPVVYHPPPPSSPEELAAARVALAQKIAQLNAQANDQRVHVVSTNAGPRFAVDNYLVMGNSVLSPAAITHTMTNIDGAYGTNVSLDGIRAAVTELQKAYQERGYVTVVVGLPQQKLTNAMVKLQVTEGRLADIEVKGNHYYSSNNVMRALPSLRTNSVLNAKVFQAELNRANASQDRQIYPVIAPGPDPGTSDLILKVKDRLPLHAKVEYNNQSSPGTPDLRLNTSAVYDNLWNLEHSIGVQYSFSPGFYKDGNQWNFYDRPLVANYGAFYRMPLGNPPAIEDAIAARPGTFGYDEATRKFTLPPASGQAELNFFASRSTIDTGLQSLPSANIYNAPFVENINENTVQQDLTVNNDLGVRFSTPLPAPGDFQSDFSGGLDFKTYQETSDKTNNFVITQYTLNALGQLNPPTTSTDASPVPETYHQLNYLPLSANYNASRNLSPSTLSWGLGLTANAWHSGSSGNLQAITGSTKSSGYWVTLTPRFSWQFPIYPNWMTTLRADGQWASEPLISNEQFGAGGVNSVRGYREGEVFGDTGWHVTLEQLTPPVTVGTVYKNTPLILRGSVYTDYARVFLLDPQGRQGSITLYDVGFGGVASIGSHWEARFLFSLPLSSTPTTEADHPFFNFDLTAQF